MEESANTERARAHRLEQLSADPAGRDDPERIELIEWFLDRNPTHPGCTPPLTHIDHEKAPRDYHRIKERWLALTRGSPHDPLLFRRAAAFVASENVEEAKGLIRSALAISPDDPKLWLDLGRLSQDPAERLAALEKALAAGETLESLQVWIAVTAFKAQHYEKAEKAANVVMKAVADARARLGRSLDWPESGADLWIRARAVSTSTTAARQLVGAISEHAYRKHWGNTVLGLLAARRGDAASAIAFLRAAADVQPDYRLATLGPSLDLLREVCALGYWDEGLEYLQKWEQTWMHPQLSTWIAELEAHRLPEFDQSKAEVESRPGSPSAAVT
jgi:tetratricopeptide (TPR) repeat protein